MGRQMRLLRRVRRLTMVRTWRMYLRYSSVFKGLGLKMGRARTDKAVDFIG